MIALKHILPQGPLFKGTLSGYAEGAMFGRGRPFTSFFLFLGLVSLDQVSKNVVSRFFSDLTVCNAQASWGFSFPLPVLIFVSICILVWMIGIQWKRREFSSAFLFVLAGGSGNLLDRITDGCVMDFFSVPPIPLFNVADVFLSIGCLLLLRSWYYQGHVRSIR